MKKLNIFLVLTFLAILIVIFLNQYFFSSSNSNNLKKSIFFTSQNIKNPSISEKERIQQEILNSFSEKIIFQNQEKSSLQRNVLESENALSQTNKNENKLQHENTEYTSFKTTEEVMEALFPNLTNRIGEEKYNEMITAFPWGFIKGIPSGLTPDQDKQYQEIMIEKRADLDMNIPDETPLEEARQRVNKINKIYIPKFINIFSKKQQSEYVELLEKHLRILK